MEANLTPKDILRMIRRRTAMILGIVAVVSGAAVFLALFVPPTYVASAKILVESQQIPEQLAASTVTVSATERLELIKQRLMARANLLDLVNRLDLYAERTDLSTAQKVDLLRRSTEIERFNLQVGRGGDVSAFTIAYRDSQPKRTAQVANEFVTMVLEQNLKARSERAAKTHDFFKEEVTELDTELRALEAEMAEFRRKNEMALPESLGFRRQELARLREERFELRRRLIQLEDERSEIAEALDTGRYAEALGTQLTPEERDLENLRTELSRARSLYAESHPTIRTLETRIAAMEQNIAASDPGALPETSVQRRERLRERLERQLRNLDTEIEFLVKRRERSDERERLLEASIEATPQVDMALNVLERRHGDLKIRFEEAVRKQAFAATGEKLEVNRQAERFEVIEQAQVPDRPTSPNRPAIALGGFAGSIGLGISLAVFLGLINPSIRTVGDMERKLEMRPVLTVPYIRTQAERRRFRRTLWASGLAIFVVLPLTLFLIHRYYLPLDLIVEEVVQRSNLRAIVAKVAAKLNL